MRQSGRWTRQYRHLAVYRRDQDVPPWTGLPTAGCHLALVRRVVERRPDVQLANFNGSAYRRSLGPRLDSEELRTALAIALRSPACKDS